MPVQVLREPDGEGLPDGLVDRMEGTDAVADAAVHAQFGIDGRVQESHPVRHHPDGPVRAGVRASGTTAASIPVLYVNHTIAGIS